MPALPYSTVNPPVSYTRYTHIISVVRRITLNIPGESGPGDVNKLQEYIEQMPLDVVLSGLAFAQARWRLQDSGALQVGRRGIVKSEVHAVTPEQARWRLDHWDLMIADYRRRGYSYPTISRIKGRLRDIISDSVQYANG